MGNTLYVTANQVDTIYKIELGQGNTFTIIAPLAQSPHPDFLHPSYIVVSKNKMAVSNYEGEDLILATLDVQVEWRYGSGSGSTEGQFQYPLGVQMDNWGRYLVADRDNYRIHIVSPNGTFVKYLVSGMSGKPRGMLNVGNDIFFLVSDTDRIQKFVVY